MNDPPLELEIFTNPGIKGIFLETAHPAKFLDIVQEATGITPDLPETLQNCMKKDKQSIKIENSYDDLAKILAERYL